MGEALVQIQVYQLPGSALAQQVPSFSAQKYVQSWLCGSASFSANPLTQIKTSSFKTKSQECNVQHREYSQYFIITS